MIKLLIFDFDGVICDSFPLVHQAFRSVCNELGASCPVMVKDFRLLYKGTVDQCLADLGFDKGQYARLAGMLKRYLVRADQTVFPHIRSVIRTLSKEYTLIVLTSNYASLARQVLKEAKLFSYFEEVIGMKNDSYAHHFVKTPALKTLLKARGLKASEVVLIGDRDLDFIEGRAAGLRNIILVEYGWGYDSKNVKGYSLPVRVRGPKDLLKAVKCFS